MGLRILRGTAEVAVTYGSGDGRGDGYGYGYGYGYGDGYGQENTVAAGLTKLD